MAGKTFHSVKVHDTFSYGMGMTILEVKDGLQAFIVTGEILLGLGCVSWSV